MSILDLARVLAFADLVAIGPALFVLAPLALLALAGGIAAIAGVAPSRRGDVVSPRLGPVVGDRARRSTKFVLPPSMWR